MLISVVNVNRAVPDAEAKKVVSAVNKQLTVDFNLRWGTNSSLKLAAPNPDAIIYLSKASDIPGVLGYHGITNLGRPYGVVLTEVARLLGEPWSITLSHEVLELVLDPEANRYCVGRHPTQNRTVMYWMEVCDATQNEKYSLDGVQVSNFVLPLYFTPGEETGSNNDFLRATGRLSRSLSSFGVAPGGYMGYYDPQTNTDQYVFADKRAQERQEAKKMRGVLGRGARYASNSPSPGK